MRAVELTRRGVLGTLVVLVVAGVCVRLGVWQLDRRAERAARNEAVAARMALPPITLKAAPRDTTGLTFRRVRLAGPVDDDRALILAGRSRNGAPGVHVLSPVRVGRGAILVDRGWLPAPDAATVDLGPVRLQGTATFEGVLAPFPDTDAPSEPEPFRVTWFRFDGDAMRDQYPYPVSPLYLMVTVRPDPVQAAGTPSDTATTGTDPSAPVPLDPPTLDPGPHLSYAVQWFSFAAIAVIGWGVVLLQRSGPGPSRPGVGSGGDDDG